MSERAIRVIEVVGVLLVSLGTGLIYLPAGLIIFGSLLILGMQGMRPRREQVER